MRRTGGTEGGLFIPQKHPVSLGRLIATHKENSHGEEDGSGIRHFGQ
jgi:hypothetical protein